MFDCFWEIAREAVGGGSAVNAVLVGCSGVAVETKLDNAGGVLAGELVHQLNRSCARGWTECMVKVCDWALGPER